MAETVLFHHIQGLTPGVLAFADELRAAGHTVHAPDLFDGRTFHTIEEGQAYASEGGFKALGKRAEAAAAGLPADVVYAGFSFGVMTAQKIAHTRVSACGALLFGAGGPFTVERGFGPWPAGVPVQIHGMDHDPFFADGGDIDAARELVE